VAGRADRRHGAHGTLGVEADPVGRSTLCAAMAYALRAPSRFVSSQRVAVSDSARRPTESERLRPPCSA
jgi:hypothetical protein